MQHSAGRRQDIVGTSAGSPVAEAAAGTDPDLLAGLPSVGEFTRLALWMAGAQAGVSTPAHAAGRQAFRSLAGRLGWSTRAVRPRRSTRPDAMAIFTEAVVGTSRVAVASVFGPPRRVVTADGRVTAGEAYWGGQAWYYPLTEPSTAVVIEFADTHACRVVFVSVDPG